MVLSEIIAAPPFLEGNAADRTGQGSDLAAPSTGNEQKRRAHLRLKQVSFGIKLQMKSI